MPGPLSQRLSHSRPWAFAFIAWLAVLCWASSRPPRDYEFPDLPHLDKVTHFLYFAVGAAFLGLALLHARTTPLRPRLYFTLVGLARSLNGIFDEWHQTYTPGRRGGDPFDWTADTLGALLGAFVACRISPRLPRPSPNQLSP
jgi:hypothetical protein